MQQGSESWHEWRRTHITASRVAAIMGEDPWSSPMDVYNEMVEGKRKEPSESMKRGILMEPYARKAYEALTGLPVDPLVCEHPQHNWLGASLDGITFDNKVIVEIKCPGMDSFEKMKENGIPRHYWIQVQAQLFCVPEAEYAHFFAYHEGEHYLEMVAPSPSFHVELLAACEKFLEYVTSKTPPEEKYLPIEDEYFFSIEKRLQKIMEIKKKIEIEEEELKKQLIQIADGNQVEGKLVRICNATRKGSFDERKMKDHGINPDEFRKPNTSYKTISFIKKKTEE